MFDQPDWFIDKSDSLPMHKVAGVRELIASTKAIERTIPRNSRKIRALMAKFSSQKCVNYLR